MVENNLSADQLQLYNLLLKANENQTREIKAELKQNTKELTTKIEDTNKDIKILQNRNISFERKTRKNNILVFGLNEVESDDLLKITVQKLNNILEVHIKEVDINNIYRRGKTNNAPIVIEFISFLKKTSLFKNTEKLKNLKKEGLSITNDLCKEDQQEQKILKEHMKIARLQNHDAKIRGNVLFINNKKYTVQDLKKIEEAAENSSDISFEEEGEKETQESKQIQGYEKNYSEERRIDQQPVVENRTTARQKGNTNYQYSPKKTRSNKNIQLKK